MAQELIKIPVQIPAIWWWRVREEIQCKYLEHVVECAGLKEPPWLEKIFDYSLA